MYYLSWNPLTWLSEGLEKVGGAIVHAIRTLFYMLDTLLYQLIINLYNTFVLLCSSRLLDSEIMNEIAKRVGLLLGIIMVFMVTFSFIKLLLDPEKMTDNKNGAVGIIKKAFLVIIMLGSSQFVFDTLYRVQRVIIKENIIPTIIIPFAVDTENFGLLLSEEVFTSFYRVNSGLENNDEEIVLKCKGMVNRLKYSIYHYGNFEPGYICLNESVAISDEDENTGISDQEITIIDYNWLIATAVGIALIYFLFSYCVSVGVRTIQLSVLEIIAPMAIISYISPKDDTMFKKWSKVYVSTYIDAFIRIGIINFAAFLIATILDGGDKWFFWQSVGNPTEPYTKGFLMVAMILALLTFAKKAPDLLKELFPSGASKIGLGGLKMKDMVGGNAIKGALGTVAGTAIGATTGAAVGMITAGFGREEHKLRAVAGGAVSGLINGGYNGGKGHGKNAISGAAKAQWGKMKDANTAYNNGATFTGRWGAKIENVVTAGQSTAGRLEREQSELKRDAELDYKINIDMINRQNQSLQTVTKTKSEIKELALKRLHQGKLDGLDTNTSGANSVLNLESKISALKENLNNVDPTDTAKVSQLNSELLYYQQALNNATDTFVSNYYANANNSELDSYKGVLQSELDNHGAELYANNNINDWQGVDTMGNDASNRLSANNVTLADYQTQYNQANDRIEEMGRQIDDLKRRTGTK